MDIHLDALDDQSTEFQAGFSAGVAWAQVVLDSELRRLSDELRVTQAELANLRQVREDERFYEDFLNAEEHW